MPPGGAPRWGPAGLGWGSDGGHDDGVGVAAAVRRLREGTGCVHEGEQGGGDPGRGIEKRRGKARHHKNLRSKRCGCPDQGLSGPWWAAALKPKKETCRHTGLLVGLVKPFR